MERNQFLSKIELNLQENPIVALLGPRQCGKTTLARQLARKYAIPPENYFDLEDIEDLARLERPKLALSVLSGLVVIDEIQRSPELFPTLRVLADREDNPIKILILGSASPLLIKQSSETLAGRISYLQLTPFSINETREIERSWMRGGFPRSYLAPTAEQSYSWRKNYISTFLEKDIPSLGFNISATKLYKFWMLLTAYHGCVVNYSDLARDLQMNYKTAQHYVEILHETFMIRILYPWHENITKRQVKSPKIYFRDSGIFHSMLGATDDSFMLRTPKLGSSWEGFALEELIRLMTARDSKCYFWSLTSGAEIDLVVMQGGQRYGFEFKYSDHPKITKSMRSAMAHLGLKRIDVIHPGDKSFPLDEDIFATSLKSLISEKYDRPWQG